MINRILVFFIIFTSFELQAQEEYNYFFDWEYQQCKYIPLRLQNPENVKEIVFDYKTDAKAMKYIRKYNKSGEIVESRSWDKRGNELNAIIFDFDENDNLVLAELYRKEKLKSRTDISYNQYGRRSELRKTNSRGKQVLLNTWKYNSDTCCIESTRFKRGDKIKKRWEYQYHEKCNRSKTILYNGKGKVKNIWSYECEEEGKKLEKNELQVCYYNEATDKYLFTVNQTFDEKGKVRKFVTKYSKTDTSLVENYMYDDKDSLVYRITYDGDWKFPLESIHYKKGKENYKTINLYENGKLLTRTQYNRGKMTGRKEFRYENDILSEFISYNRKNEISERISLNIQMYN